MPNAGRMSRLYKIVEQLWFSMRINFCGFPRAPLNNGIGRYIKQLQRITIKFCKHSGSSRGIREFLETDLIDFARNNPETVVYVKPRRHRNPVLVGEYLNGERNYQSIHNNSLADIRKFMDLMRTQASGNVIRYKKNWHTDNPSIQGPWNPFVNRKPEMNLVEFPNEELSQKQYLPQTATEQLLELFKKQKLEQSDSVLEKNRAE